MIVHDSSSCRLPVLPIWPDQADRGTNLCTHFRLNRATSIKARRSGSGFEDTFTLRHQHSFLETHACIAFGEPGGRITVWATTQNPFVVRHPAGQYFQSSCGEGAGDSAVFGGGYGGKVYPKVDRLPVALSQKSGGRCGWCSPAKSFFTRSPNMHGGNPHKRPSKRTAR